MKKAEDLSKALSKYERAVRDYGWECVLLYASTTFPTQKLAKRIRKVLRELKGLGCTKLWLHLHVERVNILMIRYFRKLIEESGFKVVTASTTSLGEAFLAVEAFSEEVLVAPATLVKPVEIEVPLVPESLDASEVAESGNPLRKRAERMFDILKNLINDFVKPKLSEPLEEFYSEFVGPGEFLSGEDLAKALTNVRILEGGILEAGLEADEAAERMLEEVEEVLAYPFSVTTF